MEGVEPSTFGFGVRCPLGATPTPCHTCAVANRSTTPPTTPPAWPYPDVVRLYAHPSGQWCRKYTLPSGHRRPFYFGVWSNPAAALADWRRRDAAIRAGTDTGPTHASTPRTITLLQLSRLWLRSMKDRSGGPSGLSPSTINTHRAAIKVALDILDPHNAADRALPDAQRRPSRRADTITIADFDRLARHIIRTYSPHHVQHIVVAVGAMYRWAAKRDLVPMPNLGDELSRPKKSVKRGHRRNASRPPYTPAQVRAMLAASDPLLRACILLFANMSQGAADIARLRASSIERRIHDTTPGLTPPAQWARLVDIRSKTKTDMAAVLWPETMAAIVAARDRKPTTRGNAPHPTLAANPSLLLTDERGRPLVHPSSTGNSTIDNIGVRFRRMMRRLRTGAPELFPSDSATAFYHLRHTFASAAERMGDRPDRETRRLVMGHTGVHDMDEVYIHTHGWEPIERLCAGMRSWLFEAHAPPPPHLCADPDRPCVPVVAGQLWSGVLPSLPPELRHRSPDAGASRGRRRSHQPSGISDQ